jgi:hypothetical protein
MGRTLERPFKERALSLCSTRAIEQGGLTGLDTPSGVLPGQWHPTPSPSLSRVLLRLLVAIRSDPALSWNAVVSLEGYFLSLDKRSTLLADSFAAALIFLSSSLGMMASLP